MKCASAFVSLTVCEASIRYKFNPAFVLVEESLNHKYLHHLKISLLAHSHVLLLVTVEVSTYYVVSQSYQL